MSIVNVPSDCGGNASERSLSSGKCGEQREREEWFRATRERD